MRRFVRVAAFGLLVGVLAVLGRSDPPDVWGQGVANITQGAPAGQPDPNAAFAVTPEAGTWMICAASYMGPDAPELAYKLVLELRGQHRYPAYVFNRATEERRQLQEELDRWQKEHPEVQRPHRRVRIEEQCAVLIGGFRDLDRASAELKKIRLLPPPQFKLSSGRLAFDTYDVYEPDGGKGGVERKRYAVNPFHTAFVIRNPALPPEARPVRKVDPFWKKLNAGEPRSLLKCPKPWTLAVQEYTGTSVIQPTSGSSTFLEKLGLSDNNLGKRLDAAAQQAQQVADLLKKLGFQTYVLHTRTSSVVTVGAFDGPNDPQLLRVQEQLSRFSFRDGAGKEIVQLFPKAKPMEVPRP